MVDLTKKPLASYPMEEIIASDDNDGHNNHKFATNYLYADGTVGTIDIDADVRERGINIDVDWVEIGPDSPLEIFQKLQVD